ncbi:hypothetical protein FMN50_19875 [Rhodobacterales bacterium]|nr:hypothetical protein FMN50_19875 [Rhodobacterales bacterium]
MSFSAKLSNDLFCLWFHAPIVIALRCQSMAAAAMAGTPQDDREISRMSNEKSSAAIESAIALNAEVMRQGLEWSRQFWLGSQPMASSRHASALSSTLSAAAIAPFAKRVRANQRRLSRRKS